MSAHGQGGRVEQVGRAEQEPEYRAIFEASSDGLVVNDLDTGAVLEANPAFCRMHGYDRMTGLHPTVGASRGFGGETEAASVPPEDAGPLLAHLGDGVVVMEDVRADPRLPASIRRANEREGVRSTMTAPIRTADGAMIGAFGLSYCQPRAFNADEQLLLQALAQRAALAIQNARLYEQAQQAAALEERQRLARDLHDAVTQTLFSTALIADVLPTLWDANPTEGRRQLAELRRLTRGARPAAPRSTSTTARMAGCASAWRTTAAASTPLPSRAGTSAWGSCASAPAPWGRPSRSAAARSGAPPSRWTGGTGDGHLAAMPPASRRGSQPARTRAGGLCRIAA